MHKASERKHEAHEQTNQQRSVKVFALHDSLLDNKKEPRAWFINPGLHCGFEPQRAVARTGLKSIRCKNLTDRYCSRGCLALREALQRSGATTAKEDGILLPSASPRVGPLSLAHSGCS